MARDTRSQLYEVVPAGARANLREVDKLKYQQTQVRTSSPTNEALTVKIRYKDPIGTRSKLITRVLAPAETDFATSYETLRFAAAVAQFGMLPRDSKHKGRGTFGRAIQLAQGALGADEDGRRSEFVYLLKTARTLAEARQISQAVPPERENIDARYSWLTPSSEVGDPDRLLHPHLIGDDHLRGTGKVNVWQEQGYQGLKTVRCLNLHRAAR